MRLLRERLEELMISLEYDEFDEEDINDIIYIYQKLNNDPENTTNNNVNNIDYFNTNIISYCKNNINKILLNISNKEVKDKFNNIFKDSINLEDNTSIEEGEKRIPNSSNSKEKIQNSEINNRIQTPDNSNEEKDKGQLKKLDITPGNEPKIERENEQTTNPIENKDVNNDNIQQKSKLMIHSDNSKGYNSKLTSILIEIDNQSKQDELKAIYNELDDEKRKHFVSKILFSLLCRI